MNRYQYRTWLALDSIKTFFGYRNRCYQPISQIEIEQTNCSINESTSCIDDKISRENSKSSLRNHIDNINMKQIDEILPLINEKPFSLNILVPSINSYTNDTRPDVDLLEC
ncbi:unnamed protein product [Adineta steineri]|uniref:Uncharacterized protein n=1 Tax=Adineta steineri TaxID=433720 RepID=A0A814DEZ6_9BILA|nr:unnamed protein product [Adineta steineri]